MKRSFLFCAIGMTMLAGAGCSNTPSAETPSTSSAATFVSEAPTSTPIMQPTTLAFPGVQPAAEVNKKVRIKTSLGDIVIQVNSDLGPKAASNFVYLVKQGFYNGTIFHRVIPGFMIQGGDPTGTGMGGPGYQFDNDTVNQPYADGLVAMANAGMNTNGSQFFIMVADYPLGPNYSQFGRVVEGLDIAHKIAATPRDDGDRPLQEVKMVSVTIEE